MSSEHDAEHDAIRAVLRDLKGQAAYDALPAFSAAALAEEVFCLHTRLTISERRAEETRVDLEAQLEWLRRAYSEKARAFNELAGQTDTTGINDTTYGEIHQVVGTVLYAPEGTPPPPPPTDEIAAIRLDAERRIHRWAKMAVIAEKHGAKQFDEGVELGKKYRKTLCGIASDMLSGLAALSEDLPRQKP